MRVLFNPNSLNLDILIDHPMRGQGGVYFQGYRQRGGGFSDVFRHLYRFLLPVAKTIGKEGIDAGKRIFNDLQAGSNIKSALKKGGVTSAQNLLQKATDKIGQYGEGRRKKRHLSKKEVIGKVVKAKALNKNPKLTKKGVYQFGLY